MIYHACRAEFSFSKSLWVKRTRVVVSIYDFIKWQLLDTNVCVITKNDFAVCVNELKGDNVPITSYFALNSPQPCLHLIKNVWKSKMPSLTVGILKGQKAPIFSTLFIKTLGCLRGARLAMLSCFLWSAPEQTAEQTIETLVIWDAIVVIMTSL